MFVLCLDGFSSGLTQAFTTQHRTSLMLPHRFACYTWFLLGKFRIKSLRIMKVRKKANRFLMKLNKKPFLAKRNKAFKLMVIKKNTV